MNSINESLISERGTNMKRTHLIAALVGIVAMGIFAADASAMYHPGMGTFMQRDPGAGGAHRLGAGGAPAATGRFIPRDPTGSNQYADGMNLYQYVRSSPTVLVDPSGLISADAWRTFYNRLKALREGQKDAVSVCEAFVELVESANNEEELDDLAGGLLPRETLLGKGLSKEALAKEAYLHLYPYAVLYPKGFSQTGKPVYGKYYEDISTVDALKDNLGFNQCLSANEHWNVVHFAGIASCKYRWTYGKDRLIQQLEEDLRQYDDAVKNQTDDLKERCAELTIDLITLRYIDGLKEANQKDIDATPWYHLYYRTDNRDAFRKDFNLKAKICKLPKEKECDCDQTRKEVEGYLRGLKR